MHTYIHTYVLSLSIIYIYIYIYDCTYICIYIYISHTPMPHMPTHAPNSNARVFLPKSSRHLIHLDLLHLGDE